MTGYENKIELKMLRLFETLSEKDKRRYAAIEAEKLPLGGTDYISTLFRIDPKTIRRGKAELDQAIDEAKGRIRKKGGGKKCSIANCPELEANFLKLLEEFRAGDPMRIDVLWTNLSRPEISRRLAEMGTPCHRHTVRKLLKKHNMGQRKARKKKSLGNHVDRNAQFENIAKWKAEFVKNGDPIISIDTKKKELIGNFSRDGKTYTQVQVETSDHDFTSAADAKLIPHGIFDVVRNEGHLNLNISHDTSEFCCESIAHWWLNYGRKIYATASKILILCDGGGSNSSRSNLFKEALKKLAIQLGIDIRIAHYPPYCSKHNPIEHRFFSHVTRACQGVVFHSVAIAKQFMEKTKTSKGLKVTVDVLTGIYATGKKCAADFSKSTCIISDEYLPLWNYQAMGAK